jgi:Gas vesicle synthesis protein GvpL/GvpF
VIEIYAITDTPPRDPRGLTAVRGDGLVALCGQAETEQQLSADQLWRHEEVVESLMEECELLPVRYGTRVEDEDAAQRVLIDRRNELVNALDRVRGAVEVSLRVFVTDFEDDVPPGGGADYLEWRARRQRDRLAARACVHGRLALLARDSAERVASDPHELFREAYLVDRSDVEAFVARVAELEAANSRLRLLCTGPWPAYSFTGR